MRVLAVNLGSSSFRLSIVGGDDQVSVATHTDGDADPLVALGSFVGAHRLVHGGPGVRRATVVDDHLRRQLDVAAAMAPLHVPPGTAAP
jgi:acetate kinase